MTSEIVSFLQNLEKDVGEPISLKNKFHVPLLSILWHVVAGRDCDEERQDLHRIFTNSTKYDT